MGAHYTILIITNPPPKKKSSLGNYSSPYSRASGLGSCRASAVRSFGLAQGCHMLPVPGRNFDAVSLQMHSSC